MTARLCTVCARGGSKGVPNKNLALVGGRTLVGHAIRQARQTGLFDVVGCSSDSPAILEAAAAEGADLLVRRPDALATDESGKLPALQHIFARAEAERGRRFDTYVDLDATSPLRTLGDIAAVVRLVETTPARSVITGAPARRSPYFSLVEERSDGTVGLCKTLDPPVLRRQDAPRCFDMNAAVYAWKGAAFREDARLFYPDTRLYEMPEERSHDIDTPLDLDFVRFMMKRRQDRA